MEARDGRVRRKYYSHTRLAPIVYLSLKFSSFIGPQSPYRDPQHQWSPALQQKPRFSFDVFTLQYFIRHAR